MNISLTMRWGLRKMRTEWEMRVWKQNEPFQSHSHPLIQSRSMCELCMVCLYYNDKARSFGLHLLYELILKVKSDVAFSFTTVQFF